MTLFRFGFSQILIFFGLIPLLIVFFVYAFRQKKKAMALFGNLALVEKLTSSVSREKQIWKVVLY